MSMSFVQDKIAFFRTQEHSATRPRFVRTLRVETLKKSLNFYLTIAVPLNMNSMNWMHV